MDGDSGDEGNDELTCVRSDENLQMRVYPIHLLWYGEKKVC